MTKEEELQNKLRHHFTAALEALKTRDEEGWHHHFNEYLKVCTELAERANGEEKK